MNNVSLQEFAKCLSNSDVKVLEKLVSKKHRKFVKFFDLMKDYTSYIKKMTYEFTDDDTLSITLKFTKNVSFDEKKDLIREMGESGYVVNAEVNGRDAKISIIKSE